MKDIIIAMIGSGALASLITIIANKITFANERFGKLEKGLMTLMGMNIRNQCKQAIMNGSISFSELKQIQEMNAQYKACGGDGYVKTLMERIEQLDIVDE